MSALLAILLLAQASPTKVKICDQTDPTKCASVDATGALKSSATLLGGGTTCRATASAPTYVDGTDNPVSCDDAGNLRTTGGGTGGGTAAYTDGTSDVKARTFDADTGAGTQNVAGMLLRKPASGGSVAFGTSTDPVGVQLFDGGGSALDPRTRSWTLASGTDSVAAVQSGTWNITNITGTISLPTGAATDRTTAAGPVSTRLSDGAAFYDAAKTGQLPAVLDGSGFFKVHEQGTATVAGTVTANQGGTWTVQPGNTANTTAWKVDGSAVTQPVSGNVTANQGGTWTVQPGNTPNTTAWKVDGSAVTQPISGTVAATESGTWTVQPGNTPNSTPWLASNNDGTNTQKVLAASTAPAAADKAAVVALSPTPAPVCTGVINISQITSTDVHTATGKTYICSIVLVSDTAQFVNVIEGTGAVCATGGAALLGSTTAGNGMSFAANGGISAIAATPWLPMQTASDHLCVTQSGVGRLSGIITYKDF